MNKELTSTIIQHILANFLIISSSFVSKETQSLVSEDFLLDKTIKFDYDDDFNTKPVSSYEKIYGTQVSYADQEIKIIFTRIDFDEYFMIVQLKGSPSYGLYIRSTQDEEERYPIIYYVDPLIACSLDGKSWMECQSYLQATFLAAMEQIKDLGLSWNKCQAYQEQYEQLVSFIKFKDDFFVEAK